MTTLSHIAVGAVIAKAALSGNNIQADPLTMYAVALLFSNIPDIDVFFFGIRRTIRENLNHRIQSFLHFPLFWLVIMILFELLTPQRIQQQVRPYEIVALFSLGVHFLMDTFGYHRGICWFGPFVKKQFSITRLVTEPKHSVIMVLDYSRSAIFKVELLLISGSLLFLLIKRG